MATNPGGDSETGQLSNQPARPDGPKVKNYVGVSADELNELGIDTPHGSTDEYRRNDIQEFKDGIVVNENMTAGAPTLFEPGTDQRGETNDVQQRSEDGDAGYGDSPDDNAGLDDAGDGDPATSEKA